MKRWKHISAFLIAPLGTPLLFSLWNGIAFEPRSLSGILSAFPRFVIYTAPAAYVVALLFGMPAIMILSRRKQLTFPAIVLCGTFIGAITGLCAGFYIGGFDINEFVDYFSFDFIDIYAPSAISGMVCSIIYRAICTIGSSEKG